jgi:hypothetical protein
MAKLPRLTDQVEDELQRRIKEGVQTGLGSRLAARFAGIGLEQDIPELRDQAVHLVDFGRTTPRT